MTTEMQLAPQATNGAMTPNRSATGDAVVAREMAEVQAAMFVAQKCPRDEIEAERRIMQSCKRRGLAEQAVYAYPRGNETVSGPSIRLAEELARQWGNIQTGIKELAQKNGESEMMAFAWDLQTGYKTVKTFIVKHERYTKKGTQKLTDPRDIYELAANMGSRRLRACILAIIPGDIVESAVNECEKTMKGNNTEPLVERVKKMLGMFEVLGVTKSQIEKRLNHKVDSIIEIELVNLRKIYKSLSDGFAKIVDFFEVAGEKASGEKTDLEKEILQEKGPDAFRPDTQKTPTPETDPDREDALDANAADIAEAIGDAMSEPALKKIEADIEAAAEKLGEKRTALLRGKLATERAAMTKKK